ncbi:hypothetical protein WG915_07580 [Corynebacterium sp. H128]
MSTLWLAWIADAVLIIVLVEIARRQTVRRRELEQEVQTLKSELVQKR